MASRLTAEWGIGIGYFLVEVAAIATSMHAVLHARTAQGATAWAIALVSFPLLSLPLYAAFGRSKFEGYAALRGVDVRILLPRKADNLLVHLAGFAYLRETAGAGVKVPRYRQGFLHQKVMLVDAQVAAVGTANLDNRSFRLNFEVTALFADQAFAAEVQHVLEVDLAESSPTEAHDFEGPANERPYWFQAAARVARLFAPVL